VLHLTESNEKSCNQNKVMQKLAQIKVQSQAALKTRQLATRHSWVNMLIVTAVLLFFCAANAQSLQVLLF
jgi:hypothetical protein